MPPSTGGARAKAGETVSGHIINTSSEAGLYGNAGQANYSSAKAGIASLTWVLARELERYGITVNSISPRARTRMTENLFGEMAKAGEGFDEWDPRNIAQLVTFLATDEASDITGQNFVVFGGNVWAMGGFHPVGRDPSRLDVDAQGTGRGQGRPVQGRVLRHPQVQLLLGDCWRAQVRLAWILFERPIQSGGGGRWRALVAEAVVE